MSGLEQAICAALQNQNDTTCVNKAYLEFIKANFIIPVEKSSQDVEPKTLYFSTDTHVFLPVFSNMNDFEAWAEPIQNDIQILKLSGVNLLKGLGEHTYVSLNIGGDSYKEFNPSELARMRSMILKLFGDQ